MTKVTNKILKQLKNKVKDQSKYIGELNELVINLRLRVSIAESEVNPLRESVNRLTAEKSRWIKNELRNNNRCTS